MNTSLIFFHFALCSFMTGVIWFVQWVHYPSFKFVGEERFKEFTRFHSGRTTAIVLPAMLLELLTAGVILLLNQDLIIYVNLFLNAALFGLTFFVSVPLHNELSKGKKIDVINKLCLTNWPRTIIWSIRFSLLIIYLFV